jgi:hypothetical protein
LWLDAAEPEGRCSPIGRSPAEADHVAGAAEASRQREIGKESTIDPRPELKEFANGTLVCDLRLVVDGLGRNREVGNLNGATYQKPVPRQRFQANVPGKSALCIV